jgi:hypothetical protein
LFCAVCLIVPEGDLPEWIANLSCRHCGGGAGRVAFSSYIKLYRGQSWFALTSKMTQKIINKMIEVEDESRSLKEPAEDAKNRKP